MSGIKKTPFKSAANYALVTGKEAAKFNAAPATTAATKRPPAPKPVVTKHTLFHTPKKHITLLPSSVKIQKKTDRGYDLVRPSPGMRPYKMTEKHRFGRSQKTITRTVKVPKFLIAPRAEDRSCVRNQEEFDRLIKLNLEEKKLGKQ